LMAVLPFCCVKEPPEISQLRAMMDKPMRVKVTDGRILTGNFHCFDNLRNIMLSDTKEALHENGDPLAGRSVAPAPLIRLLGSWSRARWSRSRNVRRRTQGQPILGPGPHSVEVGGVLPRGRREGGGRLAQRRPSADFVAHTCPVRVHAMHYPASSLYFAAFTNHPLQQHPANVSRTA
jgi:small nuclear ribonucleoprotein (snRNP)-like protein